MTYIHTFSLRCWKQSVKNVHLSSFFDYFLDYIYIVDLAFDSHQQASGKLTMTFIAMLSVCKLPTTTSCCGWKRLEFCSLLFISWLNLFFFVLCFCLFLMSKQSIHPSNISNKGCSPDVCQVPLTFSASAHRFFLKLSKVSRQQAICMLSSFAFAPVNRPVCAFNSNTVTKQMAIQLCSLQLYTCSGAMMMHNLFFCIICLYTHR